MKRLLYWEVLRLNNTVWFSGCLWFITYLFIYFFIYLSGFCFQGNKITAFNKFITLMRVFLTLHWTWWPIFYFTYNMNSTKKSAEIQTQSHVLFKSWNLKIKIKINLPKKSCYSSSWYQSLGTWRENAVSGTCECTSTSGLKKGENKISKTSFKQFNSLMGKGTL